MQPLIVCKHAIKRSWPRLGFGFFASYLARLVALLPGNRKSLKQSCQRPVWQHRNYEELVVAPLKRNQRLSLKLF